MKRIVILGPAYPFRGGLAAFNERLATELIRMGHHVDLVTFTVQYPKFLFPGKTQYSDDAPPDLTIYRWLHSFNPFNWFFTGWKLRRLNPEIIICRLWLPVMGPSLGTVIRLAKSKNTEIISILDNVIPHEKRIGDSIFIRYFLASIDRFIYMSQSVGRDLRLFEKSKPAIFVPLPIFDNYGVAVSREEAIKHLQFDPEFRYVLFFGFIRDYKGLDLFLGAIALLPDSCDHLKFIIAGEFYTDAAPYQQQIDKSGIRDRLIIHDHYISNVEVKYYFCAADLIVQPYKSATQSGIAQIAIHFNKPTVVTRVGGLHEIIDHNESGYVVDVSNQSIAEAIIDFFNREDHTSFFKALELTKANFSWNRMALAMLAGQ